MESNQAQLLVNFHYNPFDFLLREQLAIPEVQC